MYSTLSSGGNRDRVREQCCKLREKRICERAKKRCGHGMRGPRKEEKRRKAERYKRARAGGVNQWGRDVLCRVLGIGRRELRRDSR